MNTKVKEQAKNDFENDFFKFINNYISGKTMENLRKHRDIKLVATNKRRNKFVSELVFRVFVSNKNEEN